MFLTPLWWQFVFHCRFASSSWRDVSYRRLFTVNRSTFFFPPLPCWMTHLISARTHIHSSPFDHVISPSTCEIDLFFAETAGTRRFPVVNPDWAKDSRCLCCGTNTGMLSALKWFAKTEPRFAPNLAHHLPPLSAPSQRLICRAHSANLSNTQHCFHQTVFFLAKYGLLAQTQGRKTYIGPPQNGNNDISLICI